MTLLPHQGCGVVKMTQVVKPVSVPDEEDDSEFDLWDGLDGSGHSKAGSTPMKHYFVASNLKTSADKEGTDRTDNSKEVPTGTSMFNRLSDVDERLKFRLGEKSQLQFAAVVGSNTSSALQFYPLENKVQSCVNIPIELAKEAAKTYHTTLYGYFLGLRMHFSVVQRYVKAA